MTGRRDDDGAEGGGGGGGEAASDGATPRPLPGVAILISGRGSNMVSLLDAMDDGRVRAHPVLVLSNRPDAAGLRTAGARGVRTLGLDHKGYDSRDSFEEAMHEALVSAGADWVCLAGFMRILTPGFIRKWEARMLNIHPSLLPKYPGLHTHRRALEAGDLVHGASVHMVTEDLDAGPVLGRAEVPVLDGDTEDSLAARVLEQEHQLYPACLAKVLEEAVPYPSVV